MAMRFVQMKIHNIESVMKLSCCFVLLTLCLRVRSRAQSRTAILMEGRVDFHPSLDATKTLTCLFNIDSTPSQIYVSVIVSFLVATSNGCPLLPPLILHQADIRSFLNKTEDA